jgi:signal transduction histidine kinase
MASVVARHGEGKPPRRPQDSSSTTAYFLGASGLAIIAVAALWAHEWRVAPPTFPDVVIWALVVAAADLLVVRLDPGISLSMSLSITLAAAMVLRPSEAALVAFLGYVDVGEWRGESTWPQMLFNRSQVAAAIAAASLVFHASSASIFEWPGVELWALLILGVDFFVNACFVVPGATMRRGTRPVAVLQGMFGQSPRSAVLLYVSLGLVAPLMALAYVTAGAWGLSVSLIPAALAGLTLRQVQSLSDADRRIAEKDSALRALEEHLADERRDERLALAGELHDDVLPALFKVHLLGQVLRDDLGAGRLLDLDVDLPELLSAIEYASDSVRHVVSGLRASPVGPGGLSAALVLLARDLESAGSPPVSVDVKVSASSNASQLAVYLVAREAMTNAAKHSRGGEIRVEVSEDESAVRLVVADDGVGFDARTAAPENHFGLQLMRERVEAMRGTLVIDGRLGQGTLVAASFPRDG